MIIDEKSGQYSLVECIRLTEANYAKARQGFVLREAVEFPIWKQSAEMLKAIMFQGAASFSVEVGIKATVNLAGRTAGAV